ncbi:MAG TPA: prolipoprotein diacylglyceryl transferase [Bacillota bacterium]|nr:prolipoprotein diacylglyceryl transferase [Bacillota bacterium]
MHEPVFQWGSLNLPVSSLAFYTAMLIGLAMAYLEGRRKLLPGTRVIDFLLLALVGGISGGRLVYAAMFAPAYYFQQPQRLFFFHDGGFSFWGGLACALVLIFAWGSRERLIVERYLDAAALPLAFSLSWGYMGSALRGGPMGAPLPWAIAVKGQYYHPDGAYAILFFMALYAFLKRRRDRSRFEGELFSWFLLGAGAINILLDFSRELPRAWGIFTVGQLFSLAVFAAALFFVAAGPQMSFTYSSSSRPLQRRSAAATAVFYAWHILLAGLMVLAYYWFHRFPNLQ